LTTVISASQTLERNFEKQFGKYVGTIVVYNQASDQYIVHNGRRAGTRFPPFSTFKILNSIIALETGTILDVDSLYQWDTTRYPAEDWWPQTWNRKHNMRSAIEFSVVPFYRNIAYTIGSERMKAYLDKFGYGNLDNTSGIDDFWLGGSLKISAMEQVNFLRKFYGENLAVKKKTTLAVKNILIRERKQSYVLSAKTGAGTCDTTTHKVLGWYVGYIEKGSNLFFFALNIDGERIPDMLNTSIDIAKAVLKELGIVD